MNRGVAAVVGFVAVFLAGTAFVVALNIRSEMAALRAERKEDRDAAAKLNERMDGLVAGMRNRMPLDREETPLSAPPEPTTEKPAEKPAPKTTREPAGDESADFAALKRKVFEGVATEEESEEFWKTVREKPALLADIIKQLERAAADAPNDKDAHRRLADAYLAKLMSVPDGMEKGIWSNKMIGEEKKILQIDPEDWDARYSVAINYSFWPEQFNKRPDAIKEFEILRKVQETKPQEPRFARTYLQLRQLYLKEGRTEDAQAVLDEGLRRFPNDEELKKARDGAK